MDDRNPYAPSRASLAPKSQPVNDRSGATAWRDEKLLVTISDSELPPRCVKCNEPADEPTKVRKVYWHHPALYLLILINLIIYAIVATIVRRRARVAVGLCAAHKQRRRRAITFGWGGFITGVVLMMWGFNDSTGNGGVFAVVGILVTLGSIVTGMIMARIVYARKIDKSYVWLKGCSPEFLDSLPPLP